MGLVNRLRKWLTAVMFLLLLSSPLTRFWFSQAHVLSGGVQFTSSNYCIKTFLQRFHDSFAFGPGLIFILGQFYAWWGFFETAGQQILWGRDRHRTFLNSWGYNFVSFKGMSLKLIQATILELIPGISWIKRFCGYQSRDSRGQLKKSKLLKV